MFELKPVEMTPRGSKLWMLRVRIIREPPEMQGRALTEAQIGRFLQHLSITANISASAHAAHASRSTVYARRKSDSDFRICWDDALEEALDALEAEARRRAFVGYDEYVTCKDGLIYDAEGNVVTQRRYSDSLMKLLLGACRPEGFRHRLSAESNGLDGKTSGPAIMNMMIGAPLLVAGKLSFHCPSR
ncbi:hypothetical protein ACELLULO517_27365 [Acidisoma cellulosilytica]|uniref:Uncharacterized protein n=1 Tax=Acidisoma cellulosilyticum TaxID=2802395 RepID=A0A963Z7L8_9PROT|nr:hypothetical protein [Acidisoma cellulosilyticum]MCB8883989.1 hypothetical protein [Acidisoma cellulosilyticum]